MVVVVVVVVVGITTFVEGARALPLNRVTFGNVPWKRWSFVAPSMNRRKIVAGNVPPATFVPRTFVIGRVLPSWKPIHTAVVSFGV